MNSSDRIQSINAQRVSEGAGVTVWRTIGTPKLQHLDPFLLLDFFANEDPDQYLAGFPDHPHRGFITFTYMLDGHMLHKDSMGNSGDLRPGGAQWMKAASGVIHSEMPQQSSGLMRGFQLWINLPAGQKMTRPEYQEYQSEHFPVVASSGVAARVLVGRYLDASSPIQDANTDVRYLDVSLDAGGKWNFESGGAKTRFLYLFEGNIEIDGLNVETNTLAVLGEEDSASIISAGENGARFIAVSGNPVGEPIVQYGPFVMNAEHEIRQAIEDYNRGELVRG